ncbi:unnamed protein product, partial [Prorocentrum cordatum]
ALRIKLGAAETRCVSDLGGAPWSRGMVKSEWAKVCQKFGLDAASHVLKFIPAEFKLAAQLSDVLAVRNDRAPPIAAARTVAEAVGRGDAKRVDLVQSASLVVWLPSDSNAPSRCLAADFRRFAAGPGPPLAIMLARAPNVIGEFSVDGVADLWGSSILLDTWAAFVKVVARAPFPFELLFTASNAPERRVVVVDVRVEFLADLLQRLRARVLPGISCRFHGRSAAGASERPRVAVELVVEGGATDIESMSIVEELRRQRLPTGAFYAFKSIVGARGPLILEFGSPASLNSLRPFCSQLRVLGNSRALLSQMP